MDKIDLLKEAEGGKNDTAHAQRVSCILSALGLMVLYGDRLNIERYHCGFRDASHCRTMGRISRDKEMDWEACWIAQTDVNYTCNLSGGRFEVYH
jgi:hypothetical protein